MECRVCNSKLKDEYVIKVGQRLFHQVCFRCVDCKHEMCEETIGSADDIRCIECHLRKSPEICVACQKAILSNTYKKVQGRSYHPVCLRCEQCHESFHQEKCYTVEGKQYCLDCHWKQRSTIYLRDVVKRRS